MGIKYVCTIRTEHVGRFYWRVGADSIHIQALMGRVLPIDVGRRIYRSGDVLQVESLERRDTRLQGD